MVIIRVCEKHSSTGEFITPALVVATNRQETQKESVTFPFSVRRVIKVAIAMSRQQTFGKSEIVPAPKRGMCKCGNGSYLAIHRRDKTEYYCKQCARNSWIQAAEKQ